MNKKDIYNILTKKKYTDIKRNIKVEKCKTTFDFVVYVNKKIVLVIKYKNTKTISEKVLSNFSKSISSINKYDIYLTNGKDTYIFQDNKYYITTINSIKNNNRVLKVKKIKLQKIWVCVLIVVLSIFLISKLIVLIDTIKVNRVLNKIEKETNIKDEYDTCVKSKIDISDNKYILEYQEELNSYLKNTYNVSIYYENINKGYNYSYKENQVYYAASLIKIVDALYIYNNALDNNINLESTIEYTKGYGTLNKEGKEKYKYNDFISLKNLVKYAITTSDNTAHLMLLDYIGFNNLKSYGKSLGATYTLVGEDKYGSINVSDASIYLKELYKFIVDNNDYSEELKNYFLNSSSNYIDLSDIGVSALTKYGYYSNYFHNIGIMLDDEPYILVILSNGKNSNHEKMMKDISLRIYELHSLYKSIQESYCYEKIYEK